MGQEILKPWQKQIIKFLSTQEIMAEFYLTGGTALAAYYLQHRESDDLDFFTAGRIEPLKLTELINKIKENLEAGQVRLERLYDRHQYYFTLAGGEETKVEFATYPFQVLQNPITQDNLKIDSELDIAVNKIMALLDRFEPKDFVDLYFLLPKYPLTELREKAETKFGLKIEPLTLGSELAKVARVVALPKMIAPLTLEELKQFFTAEARQLKAEIFS